MASTPKLIETRIATISRDEMGIILIQMKNCGVVDEQETIDINLIVSHLSQKKPALKILDARANWSMNKKAKEIAKIENPMKTIARAIVVSGELQAALMRFLAIFENKGYPQQFFTNLENAYQWILSQKP